MQEEPIIKFEGLKQALKEKGYWIAEAEPWKPITGVDVGIEQFRTGQVSFSDEGGIEIKAEDGYTHIGFLYKRKYRLTEHGKPRMHLCRCSTLDEFIQSGSFEAEYRFAETASVMVIDMDDLDEDKEVSRLPLCKNCIRRLYLTKYSNVRFSDEFAELVAKTEEYATEFLEEKESEKDIFGYTKNWEKISKGYREKQNYTCEKCGIQITNPFQRRYIQVHHKNAKKADNRLSNLQCLCIRCHANIDEVHMKRFARGGNAKELMEFNALYPPNGVVNVNIQNNTINNFNSPVGVVITE